MFTQQKDGVDNKEAKHVVLQNGVNVVDIDRDETKSASEVERVEAEKNDDQSRKDIFAVRVARETHGYDQGIGGQSAEEHQFGRVGNQGRQKDAEPLHAQIAHSDKHKRQREQRDRYLQSASVVAIRVGRVEKDTGCIGEQAIALTLVGTAVLYEPVKVEPLGEKGCRAQEIVNYV